MDPVGRLRTVMRALHVVALLALLDWSPANALECLIPSIPRDYWWHEERPETYVLAYGQLLNLERAATSSAPGVDVAPALDYKVWRVEFTGCLASRRAFDQPFNTGVTLILPEFSGVGGGSDTSYLVDHLSGKSGLVWLMRTNGGYRATAELCGDLVDEDPAHLKPVLRCLRGGHCPKPV